MKYVNEKLNHFRSTLTTTSVNINYIYNIILEKLRLKVGSLFYNRIATIFPFFTQQWNQIASLVLEMVNPDYNLGYYQAYLLYFEPWLKVIICQKKIQ